MAKMLPERPRYFSEGSLEDMMFDALEVLSDDYYVIHSFKLVSINNGIISESETDFLIFHPQKGIISLEAKAGHIQYINGEWFYQSGIRMSHDGPYNQASGNKWKLMNYFLNSPYKELIKKCKFLHAVWFPSVSTEELKTIKLPPEADVNITLTKEDLVNPSLRIESIFSLELPNHVETFLSDKESDTILRKVLCPSFDLVPSINIENDLKKQVFHRLLSEQKCILDFLVEQKTAVIQGVAGTGKTLIALEKARRHADNGEKVLFLCYNKFLRNHLFENNNHINVDYYTIDAFACKMCNTPQADYNALKNVLEDSYFNETFPYQHIIIDEGQDFGQDNIEENDIIQLLETIIVDNYKVNGSFYIFYDSMQFVQGNKIPDYILNSDCKLTLYKNCRNTENIAKTSMKPIKDRKPKMLDSCIKGTIPKVYFPSNNEILSQVMDLVFEYETQGINDVMILTCKTENTSALSEYLSNGKLQGKYRFTTCRKFKGLEADAVIIVDVDKKVLTTDAARIFYVGASRARLFLNIVFQLEDEDCINILSDLGIKPKTKKLKHQLAKALNAVYTSKGIDDNI
ncbi:MAG: ATP-binding domain-containing protein [Saccharofermentans sp.]|nr:ATP-binding domain-containing protein [Saccharofermentans sp.]